MIPPSIWDWKPNISMRSTSELALHLACSPLAILELLKGNIPDGESYKAFEDNNMTSDAQGMVLLYNKGLNRLIEYLEKHLTEARTENIELFYEEHPTSLYKEVFSEIGHEWLHLGQLFIYLRQNGVSVDMGAYYGFRDPNPDIQPIK